MSSPVAGIQLTPGQKFEVSTLHGINGGLIFLCGTDRIKRDTKLGGYQCNEQDKPCNVTMPHNSVFAVHKPEGKQFSVVCLAKS